jgi:hypothetical protein
MFLQKKHTILEIILNKQTGILRLLECSMCRMETENYEIKILRAIAIPNLKESVN